MSYRPFTTCVGTSPRRTEARSTHRRKESVWADTRYGFFEERAVQESNLCLPLPWGAAGRVSPERTV
jgi:hypothetical protein